jgi:hypothetical protein
MENNEVKKDMETWQIIGMVALIGLAILIGGAAVMGRELYTLPSVNYPAWIDPVAIIVSIVVLIILALLAVARFRKRA